MLIVNDEIMTLMMLRTIFEKSIGVEPSNIEEAENGKIALQKALKTDFDLILMDLNMPVMGGFEAV